jgi:hypothetical protein
LRRRSGKSEEIDRLVDHPVVLKLTRVGARSFYIPRDKGEPLPELLKLTWPDFIEIRDSEQLDPAGHRCPTLYGVVYRPRRQALCGVDGPPVRHQMAERDKEKVLYSVWKTIIDYVEDMRCGGESLDAILRPGFSIRQAKPRQAETSQDEQNPAHLGPVLQDLQDACLVLSCYPFSRLHYVQLYG